MYKRQLHPPGEDYLYAVIADNELVYGAVSRLRALYPNLLGVKLEARVQGEDLPDLTPCLLYTSCWWAGSMPAVGAVPPG